MAWLLFFFLALIPLLELAGILWLNQWLGAWLSMQVIVLMSLLGVWMLQHQGLSVWRRIRGKVAARQIPMQEMLESLMVVWGGLLLLVPGYVSGLLGLLFMLPPARRALARGALGKTLNSTVYWAIEAFNEFQQDRQDRKAVTVPEQSAEADVEVVVDAAAEAVVEAVVEGTPVMLALPEPESRSPTLPQNDS